MVTATANPQVTYRKTKQGEWVVMGPTGLIRGRSEVTVAKRDGTTKAERIVRTGRPFRTPAGEMVYGYLDRQAPSVSSRSAGPERRRTWATRTHEDCLSFGGCVRPGTGPCDYH
jgi:hypothetical protein